jgi:type IV secretory pathway TrbL component
MDVLLVLGILTGVILIGFAVYSYDNFLRLRFNSTIFELSKLLLLLVSEGALFYVLISKDSMRTDNMIVLIIVAVVIFIGCLTFNIRNYGLMHGIIVTQLQFIIAFVVLFLILVIASSNEKRKRRR